MSHRDPGPPPPRWLHCPRKSHELIASKFLAFKTPLDQKFDDQIEPQFRFPPTMIMSSMRSYKVKVGLWVDLCNTSRFYDKKIVEDMGCRYVKLHCRGHGAAPSAEQVDTFVNICTNFVQKNPLEIIAVHCTHGFNRTGFLIASYLIQKDDWSPEAAVEIFAKARPPGIYKNDYIEELFARFGDVSDAPVAPPLPEWCFEEDAETGVDEDGHAPNGESSKGNAAPTRRGGLNKNNPTFMPGVSGVHPVTSPATTQEVQRKMQALCRWNKKGFPGAQPVSMDRKNIRKLTEMGYKVSWKADGMRYMMLIDGPDRVFFADRDNCIFHVPNMTFLDRKDSNVHLTNTLLDGEMVIDQDGDKQVPRFLVYDIVYYKDKNVGDANFSIRGICIEKEIIQARSQYINQGLIDRSREPFSIRLKQFWPIKDTRTLLGPRFTKESLGHEPDGLVFQPAHKPYKAGRDDDILKWKPSSHNSVDFKLKVERETRPGMLPQTNGLLFVGGLNVPFATMPKLKKEVRELNNKIIECTWDAEKKQWAFMRERTDKSYPNGFNTAQNVVSSIQEPVTPQILLNLIDQMQSREPFNSGVEGGMHPPPMKRPRH
eukprot:maker-scaffold346_size200932-snap-gene-0.7 protein:Tk04298 transcript:maker-scaffold346_size200932-snap-gene-0.7-mRNA-1 annotation:"hypothetical protein CAPTEDRAFT_167250"